MSVVRVNKNKDYTVMSNCHLREKNMSLKAKGLLSLMLSLPDSWDYSIAGLVAICKENETSVKNALKELQQFGYLRVKKLMPNRQENRTRIEYIYDIFEQPQENKKQEVENLPLENLHIDNLHIDNLEVDNHTQLNTKELNTKELNTKELNTKELKKVSKGKSFDEIIKDFCNENKKLEAELKKYLKMRFTKQKRLSNVSLEESLNNLLKVSGNNQVDMIEIVNKAVRKEQLDFYPLSEKEKQSNRNQNTSYELEEDEKFVKSPEYFDLLTKMLDKKQSL